MCINAGICAYLPVVDVSRGNVSARGAFGEDVVPQNTVAVAPVQKIDKKVVSRSATKANPKTIVASDVLKPNRPSSDLWARNTDTPLRMPRMDEIAVINSDAILPEEDLNAKPVSIVTAETTFTLSDTINPSGVITYCSGLYGPSAFLHEGMGLSAEKGATSESAVFSKRDAGTGFAQE